MSTSSIEAVPTAYMDTLCEPTCCKVTAVFIGCIGLLVASGFLWIACPPAGICLGVITILSLIGLVVTWRIKYGNSDSPPPPTPLIPHVDTTKCFLLGNGSFEKKLEDLQEGALGLLPHQYFLVVDSDLEAYKGIPPSSEKKIFVITRAGDTYNIELLTPSRVKGLTQMTRHDDLRDTRLFSPFLPALKPEEYLQTGPSFYAYRKETGDICISAVVPPQKIEVSLETLQGRMEPPDSEDE